jgi:hypothetical protein
VHSPQSRRSVEGAWPAGPWRGRGPGGPWAWSGRDLGRALGAPPLGKLPSARQPIRAQRAPTSPLIPASRARLCFSFCGASVSVRREKGTLPATPHPHPGRSGGPRGGGGRVARQRGRARRDRAVEAVGRSEAAESGRRAPRA